MRADHVEVSWDADKSNWLVRIKSGEEVIRRHCKLPKDADEEDEQIFLAAAILLTAAVGESHEPVDESQIRIAVLNAHSLHEEVKKRRERIAAGQALGWIEHLKQPVKT